MNLTLVKTPSSPICSQMKRYSRRGTKKTAVHDLPQELIIQILLRLPVKSLVRFKCVCKSWLSHISDPHFASSHYDLALSHTRRIVLFAPSAYEVRSIDSNASLHDDSACAALNLAFSPYQRCYKVKILGSCRGFLLLQYRLTLYVWNPSTGVHWHIPLRKNAGFSTFLYGFGYDPSTDDYLVVRASESFGSQADRVTRVELFSLRANTWNEIGGLSNMHTASNTKLGLLFNGAIHWLVYRGDVHANVILTFELTERSFSEIPLPHGHPFRSQLPELQILGGFLCLCHMGFYNNQTEIWVMEEYKVLSSWKKSIVVCTHDVPAESFFPLCSTKSGDIVGTDNCRGLVKCDDKGHIKEHHHFCDDYDHGFQVAVFTESLLSLPSDN